jgi:hypothetical protein
LPPEFEIKDSSKELSEEEKEGDNTTTLTDEVNTR